MKKYLFIFIGAFIFSLVFFYIFGSIYCDEVWVYGFSYNLSRGMVIYRDYNVLQMPLYFFIASIFIKLFGNYLIVMHIFDSLLFASIILMLYKIINWKSLLLLPVFMFFWPSGYNLLSLFFLILIIYLIHIKKDDDWLIGLIVGLCFITKQNIGILLFIPMFLYSKNKIKSVFSFMLPFLILSIYLVYNNALYEFIDYCFLGMLDFNNKNKYIDYVFLILFGLNVIILLYNLIKGKFKNKELFYILIFQFIMYPLFDIRHYVCSLFPVLYLGLKKLNNKLFLIIIGISVYTLYMNLLCIFWPAINVDKGIDFLRDNGDLEVLAMEVKEYVGDSENFFFTDYYNYYIKLYYNIPISQYDLLLSGNVGYDGVNRKLKELNKLCSKEKCYFFTEKVEQPSILSVQYKDFYDYIIDNYEKVDTLYKFDIYTNNVEEN